MWKTLLISLRKWDNEDTNCYFMPSHWDTKVWLVSTSWDLTLSSEEVWKWTEGFVPTSETKATVNFILWSRKRNENTQASNDKDILGDCTLIQSRYQKLRWRQHSLVKLAYFYDFCQQCWNQQFKFLVYCLKHALLRLVRKRYGDVFSYMSTQCCGSKPALEKTIRAQVTSFWWPLSWYSMCGPQTSSTCLIGCLSRLLNWNLHLTMAPANSYAHDGLRTTGLEKNSFHRSLFQERGLGDDTRDPNEFKLEATA